MKFIILIFALLVNIKLCFKRLFDSKNLDIWDNSLDPIFLENQKSTIKNKEKNTYLKKNNGYRMKITFIKETDIENSKLAEIEGNVKLDTKFEIFGDDGKLKNEFSFLR